MAEKNLTGKCQKRETPLPLCLRGFCYPTWIRTKTSRTRICGTTVILSGNYIAKLKNLHSKKNRNFRFGFVARPGFEPRQTVPKTVVLPLYYRAIRKWIAKIRFERFASKRNGTLKDSFSWATRACATRFLPAQEGRAGWLLSNALRVLPKGIRGR